MATTEPRTREPHRNDPSAARRDEAAGTAEAPADSPLLNDIAAMEDEEIAASIREAFEQEVGEALDDVRIACCDGVVTLAGEVPNEALPAVARRIVEDELGFEVVDRMLVIDTAGGPKREVDEAEASRNPVPDETLALDDEELEGEVSEDILETEEEGLVFVPPTRPVPERE